MNELVATSQRQWPEKIMVSWRRLASGLWRVPESDISAAYCADTFPKIKVFTHEGAMFTNCGTHFGGPILTAANCYPLIPAGEYVGPEPQRYTYEGCEARYKGKAFKLGAKVVFAAIDASVDEWRGLLRVMYADGGWFARQANYGLFLAEDHTAILHENGNAALRLENSGELVALTKLEMQRFLNGERTSPPDANDQLELGFSPR